VIAEQDIDGAQFGDDGRVHGAYDIVGRQVALEQSVGAGWEGAGGLQRERCESRDERTGTDVRKLLFDLGCAGLVRVIVNSDVAPAAREDEGGRAPYAAAIDRRQTSDMVRKRHDVRTCRQ
jgi:hypothetical protein